MQRKIKIILLVAMISLLVTSCTSQMKETQASVLKEGQYLVYYKNQEGTALSSTIYETDTKEDEVLARELLKQLTVQPEDITLVPVISETTASASVKVSENTAYLYFSNEYSTMEKSEEILCRAAIVKTLTQLENVSYVDINVNNKPLKKQNGEEVGLLSPSNFIESDDTSMVTKHTITLMLYYTNEEGNALVETNRQILYDNSLSLENLVINELIAGPNTEDMYPTLPSTLKVLSVSTKDGICYVNLDSSFVTDALDVAEYVPIYSIVNSLVELSGITKVQISVNGSFDLVFKEKIPLTQIFEWNSDYLGGDYH